MQVVVHSVIATDNGGNKELVDDQVTGFLIPDGDINKLIGKLLWIYQHPIEAKKMGENGRTKILNHFSVETMVSKTLDLYETVMC